MHRTLSAGRCGCQQLAGYLKHKIAQRLCKGGLEAQEIDLHCEALGKASAGEASSSCLFCEQLPSSCNRLNAGEKGHAGSLRSPFSLRDKIQ